MAAAAGSVLVLASLATPVSADVEVRSERLAGPDRYGTAAEIAAATFPDGAATALIARGDDFADAVAAASLAGRLGAPVLLTRSDSVPAATREALTSLGVDRVVLLGGEQAIGAAASDALAADYVVERVAGPDRFGTAAEIALRTADAGDLHTVDGARAVVVVNGTAFPDALAAGAPSAALGLPILLVDQQEVPAVTAATLDELDIGYAYVAGGTDVVGEPVVRALQEQGLQVERLAGDDRTGTAVAVAQAFVQMPDGAGGVLLEADTVLLARGDDFADALAAAPHAGQERAAILLTASPSLLGPVTADYLDSAGRSLPRLEVVRAIGGTAAITDEVLSQAVEQASPVGDGVPSFDVFPIVRQTPPVGTPVELTLSGLDGDAAYSLALFPCDAVQGVGQPSEPDTFADSDGDGRADGRGSSDTGAAVLQAVDGDPVEPTGYIGDVRVASDPPQLSVELTSEQADCATLVIWEDLDGSDQLTLQPDGRPAEPYGVAQVDWRALGADGLPLFGPAGDQQALQGDGGDLRLDDVRVAEQDGYDRVVFSFTGDGTPGWRMRYVSEPARQGSGHPVELAGEVALAANITDVAMPTDGDVYDGPERLDGPGQAVLEVFVGGWFEGNIDNFVGAAAEHPFRVFRLEDPARVVVDVQHP